MVFFHCSYPLISNIRTESTKRIVKFTLYMFVHILIYVYLNIWQPVIFIHVAGIQMYVAHCTVGYSSYHNIPVAQIFSLDNTRSTFLIATKLSLGWIIWLPWQRHSYSLPSVWSTKSRKFLPRDIPFEPLGVPLQLDLHWEREWKTSDPGLQT
jgi:hypothetical protein